MSELVPRRPGLRVNRVSFHAAGRAIVDDVSFAVAAGETLAIVGPSGCGKTTLLRLIAGLHRLSAGTVFFDDEDLAGVPVHKRRFGMMFQDFALFPHLDVEENVAFGLRRQITDSSRTARVTELLELVGLAGFGKRTIEALSGGERQRVALARSIAPEPRLLMLDEPLGSLDRGLRERLLVELKAILGRLQIPTVYVTHDQFEAFAMGTRMAIMRSGKIIRSDTPQTIFEHPETTFVARFLGLENIVAGERSADGIV
ncbi:MAG: ABC transporter ATP-binding protein, partial [Anaerolineaceae bacterium]